MRQTIKKTVALILTVVMLLSMTVTVVNAGGTTEIKDGDILCRVNFNDTTNFTHTKVATDNNTVTVNDKGFTCNIATASKDTGFKTTIKKFELSTANVYTIDFAEGETIGKSSGQAGYLYIGTENKADVVKYGFMLAHSNATDKNTFMKNTTTGKSYGYVTNNLTPYTEDADGVRYVFYRLVVDVDNGTTQMYILSEKGEYVHATGTDSTEKTFEGSYLNLTMYSRSKADQSRAWKDIIIYKGDRMQSTTFDVSCNEETNTQNITNGMYTLPIVKKAGYVFAGWRINDAATLTPAETVIPDARLAKIEAVFEEVMSDVGVQFKTNENDSSKTDIRIVGVIDSLGYDVLGYNVVIKEGDTQLYSGDIEITTVYESLTATYSANEVKPVTVKDLGYAEGYLTSFAIKGVKEEITIILTPSYTNDSGKTDLDSFAITVNVKNKTATKSEVAV